MADTLAELIVKISADATELKKALAESEKDIEKTGKSFDQFVKDNKQAFKTVGVAVTAFGAAITGTLVLAVKSFAGLGTELKELSQKTGISVESLSELKYVGDMTSVSLADLAIAIRGMANFMETASTGSEETAKTLKKLGLSLADVSGLDPERLFMKLSSAIASIPDPIKRSALAVDIFGRSGTALLPMLAEGQNGIAQLRQKAQELGITMSTETANAADELGDALDTVKDSVGGVFNAIGLSLAPIITDLAGKIADIMGKVKGWADAHPELSKNILLVVGGLGLLALAVGPILIFLPQIIGQIAALKIAFLALDAAMGPVGWAIAGIGAALVIALPFILTATSATKDLTSAEGDLAEQTARTNLQRELDAQSWTLLTEGGKIYETQLDGIAASSGMTTKALYAQLKAAGLVQQVWGGEEGAIYLRSLKDIEAELDKVTNASDNMAGATQGTKQAMGSATWTADGYRYSMQLFTQAEIDAAKASGKKVDVLQTQSDITQDNTEKTKDYKEAIDSASTSVLSYTEALANIPALGSMAEQTRINQEYSDAIEANQQALSLINQQGDLGEILTLMETNPAYRETHPGFTAMSGLGMSVEEIIKWLQATNRLAEGDVYEALRAKALASVETFSKYQYGGIAWHPQIASLAETEPELITPLSKLGNLGGNVTINFTEPIFFDREDSMNKFVDKISKTLDRKYRLSGRSLA
jgi:hypothetical protein